MRTRLLIATLATLLALAIAAVAWSQSSAPPASGVSGHVVDMRGGLTSEISTTLVVRFENHTAMPVTVTRYHVEWSGGHTREGTQSFTIPAHGNVERTMRAEGMTPTELAAFHVVLTSHS